MRYEILACESAVELETLVQDYINAGWEPIGGVALTSFEYEVTGKGYTERAMAYTQAMIKKEEK